MKPKVFRYGKILLRYWYTGDYRYEKDDFGYPRTYERVEAEVVDPENGEVFWETDDFWVSSYWGYIATANDLIEEALYWNDVLYDYIPPNTEPEEVGPQASEFIPGLRPDHRADPAWTVGVGRPDKPRT